MKRPSSSKEITHENSARLPVAWCSTGPYRLFQAFKENTSTTTPPAQPTAATTPGTSGTPSTSAAPTAANGKPTTGTSAAPTAPGKTANGTPAAGIPATPGKPGTPAPTPAPALSKEAEIAAVKAMLTKASQAKTLGELSPYLSNQTASNIAAGLVLQLFMISGGMAPTTTKLPPAAVETQKDVNALLTKYGLDMKGGREKNDAIVKAKGRQMLADLDPLMARTLERFRPGSAKQGYDIRRMVHLNPNEESLSVVSPTVVKVTGKGKDAEKNNTFNAIFEEGTWRMNLPMGQRRGNGGPRPGGQRPGGRPGEGGAGRPGGEPGGGRPGGMGSGFGGTPPGGPEGGAPGGPGSGGFGGTPR